MNIKNESIDFIALCYELPPWLLAGAIWTEKLLLGLRDQGWKFEVITASPGAAIPGVVVHHVPNPGEPGWLSALTRAKLDKLHNWVVWPDEAIFWNEAAVQFARGLIEEKKPKMIVNFMMPYGAGMAGERLKAETGLPLVYCFSDSFSCTDMNPCFPTWFHYRHAIRLEDRYVRTADAVVYVSQFNADLVRKRHLPNQRDKFHVVRLGADASEFAPIPEIGPVDDETVRVVYIGVMGGWHQWYQKHPVLSRIKQVFDHLGRHTLARLDHRTHSPIFVGRAVQQVLASRPDWRGKIFVDLYGSHPATDDQIHKILKMNGLNEIVRVFGPQARPEIARHTRTADLLFQCVQSRTDNSPGGRIASKTYEYLMTDRPILAAVPKGENWDYYSGKPGVWLVAPDEVDAMTKVILEICEAKLDRRQPLSINRDSLRDELAYTHRSKELATVLRRLISASLPLASKLLVIGAIVISLGGRLT